MFLPSKLHHRSCIVTCKACVPDVFSLLSWNVHKNNTKDKAFNVYLQRVAKACDFLLFQEAHFQDDTPFTLAHFAFDAAANLEINKTFYGVLTASKVASKQAQAFLSEGKESLWGPHKSLLLSSYPFEDGSELLILNVHAINFRENKRYQKELERFLILIQNHKGPLIVSGDFNTWNKNRMQKLEILVHEMGLNKVIFPDDTAVKRFMGKPLDFILYRGLDLLSSHCEAQVQLSDHNPLFATFKKK